MTFDPICTNDTRADAAAVALNAFCEVAFAGESVADLVKESGPEGDALDAVGDLIGNLGHLCARFGIPFATALERGQAHFEYESAADYAGD